MDLYLIGVIKQRNSTIGYRLLDLEFNDPSKKVIDIKSDYLLRYLKDKRLSVHGVSINDQKLIGSNGSLDRYTVIKMPNRDAVLPQAAVVLKQVGDSKYRIQDFNGNIITVKDTEFIDKVESGNLLIANGKVVQRSNGTKFISAISGQYDQIPDDDKETSADSLNTISNNNKALQINEIESKEKKEKLVTDRKNRDKRLSEKYDEMSKKADNSEVMRRSDRILRSKEVEVYKIAASELENGASSRFVLQFERQAEEQILRASQNKLLQNADRKKVQDEVDKVRKDFYNKLTGGAPLTDNQTKTVLNIRHKARIDILDKLSKESVVRDSLGNTVNAVNKPVVRETVVQERIQDVLSSQITYRNQQGLINTEELTVTSKLQAAIVAFRRWAPYYFYVIQQLKLVESSSIPTMAADENAIYYNAEFVNDLELECLVFILMHETCHVLMNHQLRGKGKLHYLYNIACDLYVNKFIVDEFEIDPMQGKQSQLVPKQSKADNGNKSSFGQKEGIVGIKFPDDAQYQQLVNVNIDTPEQIYLKLEQEFKKNLQMMQSAQNQQGQGQQDQNQQGQGQQGQGQQGQGQQGQGQQGQGQQGQGQQGQGQQGQGQNQQGQGQGQGQQDQNQQGQQGQGSGQSENVQDQNQKEQPKSQNLTPQEVAAVKKTLEEIFEVKIDQIDSDLVTNEKHINDSESDRKSRQKQAAASAKVRLQKGGVKSYSTGLQDVLQRSIESTLAPVVNWRYALRRLVQSSKTLDYSYQKPKRQYLQQNMIFPQDVPGDPDTIGTVLIAIDTSGSIQDQEIGMALKQILDLLRKFKQTGIIVYWDTQIAAQQQFKSVNEALRLRPAGGGGTDPNCIFEYLEKDKLFKHKINKRKIEAIIVFTDGCFGDIEEKYRKKYGKKTVWVVNGYDSQNWKAPMGITAPFKE